MAVQQCSFVALDVQYLQNACLFLSNYSIARSGQEQTSKEIFLEADARLSKLLNFSVYWYRYIQLLLKAVTQSWNFTFDLSNMLDLF